MDLFFLNKKIIQGPKIDISEPPPFVIVFLKIRHVKSFVAVVSKLSFVETLVHCNWLSTAIQPERVTFHTLP